VFGYGSLVADCATERAVPCTLTGFRRVWGVAADNLRTTPGYKMYLSRRDGSRPSVYIAFLDIDPAPGESVGGLAMPVDDDSLAALDLRERNYDRLDVTGAVEGVAGRVWTYRGSRDGRARLQEGARRGIAVISRDYLEKVASGLEALGHPAALPEGLPVRDLDRVDLPL
jgi:hypothetical protein